MTMLVKAERKRRCIVNPSYLERTRGETTLRAQFKQSIAVGSPVATSGVMQS
ncbi:MAG: hypothetical protein NWF04_09970 [Candidatus Bathyarchaeota archaeon]|nr:hypothetical protein [Candidatus Bathyarchaeota archaeon]